MQDTTETYIPKKPCKRGHLLRYKKNGACYQCRRDQDNARAQEFNRAHVAAWRAANPEKAKASTKAAHARNPEINRASKQRNRAQQSEWRKAHRPYLTGLEMKRQAQKLNATPLWLTADDHWAMAEIYELASLRTQITGIPWHVDHKYPLRGKTVSGLHVPSNLQVIPGIDNLRKSNGYY
jgi:hypothetical protein